jgi:signal transduction histidine kinase
MGVRPAKYGSVFLYKNGFRIHPFGDPDDDRLGIDRRHQHGVFRTLGTRDIAGRIEIKGRNDLFQETSSRDGGLFENQAYSDLKDLLINFALKRLEKFFIDLARFGTEKGELPNEETMSKADVKNAIFDIIEKLTNSKDVIHIDYDRDFLDILENSSADSVTTLLKNLRRIAAQQNSGILTQEIKKAEKQLARLAKAKENAEIAEANERERAKKAEEKAKRAQEKAFQAEEKARRAYAATQEAQYREKKLNTQNIFLKSVLSKDMQHVVTLHHSIGQDALTIEDNINILLNPLRDGNLPRPEKLKIALERMSFLARKIATTCRFATQANHLAAQEEINADLVEYIREYVLNIYGGMIATSGSTFIPIHFTQPDGEKFITRFSPIDISIIFDNLISNSKKHHSKNINVTIVGSNSQKLCVNVSNDGDTIPKKNAASLFEIGFTTTSGSGLGLYHVREILSEMHGSIKLVEDSSDGVTFSIIFNKQ